MTNANYVLGIDGGGTKTQAAIVSLDGRVCGIGASGPSNYDDVGVHLAQENIGKAVAQASQHAGLPAAPFAAAFFGMAGVTTGADRTAIRAMAQDLRLAADDMTGVDHDCRIALAGGLSGRPGIVLITGTGSSCYGRASDGRDWISGGWGSLISDEGSGYWLGVQAMKTAAGVDDGRLPGSILFESVRAHLGLRETRELMHRMYVVGMSRPEIAQMAPLVIEAALQGDLAALDLIRQGAQEMAACVEAVARKVGLDRAPCELTQVGGLVNAGEVYLHPVREAVRQRLPACQFSLPELPPVLGASLLALQQRGVPVEWRVLESIRQYWKEQE
jgi:N-acetylglucosamine kinase-like BadF-type ATPase